MLGLFSYTKAQVSTNTVKYQVTYNSTTQIYTAWVIPDYSLPSSFNTGSTEKGATAQFTLVVPKDFVITQITDIRGTWAKPTEDGFIKLGPGNAGQTWTGLNPELNYYVVGKTPSETDYGTFVSGTPVALFSFTGNGCFGPIQPLAPEDPFIDAADDTYSLNVANSFYSRSGQPAGGNVVPVEQFVNIFGLAAQCATPVQPSIFAFNDNNITQKNTAVSDNILKNDILNTGTAPLVVTTTPLTQPTNGSVTLTSTGNYTYTPANNFVGTDSFVYRVCDSSTPSVCDTAIVTIIVVDPVIGVNNAPVALGDNILTPKNTPANGNVLTNDKEFDAGQTLTASLVTGPSHGTLTLNSNGTYTYTPTSGYVGNDQFIYQACDNGSPVLCSQAVVDIKVYEPVAQNLPPIANDDLVFRNPTGPATGNVLINDADPEGGVLVLNTIPISGPSNGTVVLNSNGTFTYTPNAGFTGPDEFIYEVCDSEVPKACSQATAFILPITGSGNADLSIVKILTGSQSRTLGEILTYRVVVHNAGPNAATNIIVKDSVGTGLELISGVSAQGSFTNPLWNIPVIASGDSAILTVTARVITQGVSFNYALLKQADQTDNNLTNNETVACVTVPILLCSGQKVEATVPSNYTNVVWYRDGQQVGEGNTFQISQAGTYTYTTSNATCPAAGCCPLIVQADGNCCPPQICVPVTVVKKKK